MVALDGIFGLASLAVCFVLLVGVACFWLWTLRQKGALEARYTQFKMQFEILQARHEALKDQHQSLQTQHQSLESKCQDWQARALELDVRLQTKEEMLLEKKASFALLEEEYAKLLASQRAQTNQSLTLLEEKLKGHFQEQQMHLLNQNQIRLSADSKKILDDIFVPIKEQVDSYSKQLIANEHALKTHIDHLFAHAQNIGSKADKLADILKGDKKIRGNFGELQLRSILEQSGLREGEQYKLQEHFSNEGKTYIPDAVIYLSPDRSIVVDSKFVLSYEEGDLGQASLLASQLAKNLKARIDELSKKPYAHIANAHEFVLLFLPYQNLLDLALEADFGLYEYAYSKKVYLATPNTLFIALKTIDATWIRIKSNANVQKAFREIENFYEKFVLVLQEFDKLKNTIHTLNNSSQELDKRLLSGRGNLANRFAQLKQLGLKVQKEIAQDFLKEQDFLDKSQEKKLTQEQNTEQKKQQEQIQRQEEQEGKEQQEGKEENRGAK